jgi:hypothetical protein
VGFPYFYDKKIRRHSATTLDWQSLAPHLEAIRPKRLILTHFSPDMLARVGELTVEAAEDGKIVELRAATKACLRCMGIGASFDRRAARASSGRGISLMA